MIYYAFKGCEDNYISQHKAGVELRERLFAALGITASICISENGRPCIADATHRGIDFSVSHTRDLAVCAVICPKVTDASDNNIHTLDINGEKIGIDAEYIDPDADENRLRRIASRYLGTGSADKDEFYTLWTRREAFGKLCGEGVFYKSSDANCRYYTFDIDFNASLYRITLCTR